MEAAVGHGSVCGGAGKARLAVPPDWDCDVGVVKCSHCNGSEGAAVIGHVAPARVWALALGVSHASCVAIATARAVEAVGHAVLVAAWEVCGAAS